MQQKGEKRRKKPSQGSTTQVSSLSTRCSIPIPILSLVRTVLIERLGRIIPDRFHNPQPFRPPLAEQDPIAHGQVLGPLHEAEGDRGAVARPDEGAVNVDDGARLADGTDVQHGLIFRLDGRRVREDQDLGDEFPVHFWRRGIGVAQFGEDDHALADFLPADPFEGEGGGLAGAADGDGDAFALDGADVRCGELAEGVGTDEDGVAGVDDAAFHDARDDGPDEGDGKGVVYVEFEGCVGVVISVVRQYVEERPDQVEGFARHVRDLEDGADALADELGGRFDGVFSGLDENGYLARTG